MTDEDRSGLRFAATTAYIFSLILLAGTLGTWFGPGWGMLVASAGMFVACVVALVASKGGAS